MPVHSYTAGPILWGQRDTCRTRGATRWTMGGLSYYYRRRYAQRQEARAGARKCCGTSCRMSIPGAIFFDAMLVLSAERNAFGFANQLSIIFQVLDGEERCYAVA